MTTVIMDNIKREREIEREREREIERDRRWRDSCYMGKPAPLHMVWYSV